jgi:hypothetical protein
MTCSGDVSVPRVDFVDAYIVWPSHVRIHRLGSIFALLVRKMILFILDYDSNYLEYYFRIGNGFLE